MVPIVLYQILDLIVSKTKKIFLITKIQKAKKLIKEKILKKNELIDINDFSKKIST